MNWSFVKRLKISVLLDNLYKIYKGFIASSWVKSLKQFSLINYVRYQWRWYSFKLKRDYLVIQRVFFFRFVKCVNVDRNSVQHSNNIYYMQDFQEKHIWLLFKFMIFENYVKYLVEICIRFRQNQFETDLSDEIYWVIFIYFECITKYKINVLLQFFNRYTDLINIIISLYS